MSRSGGRIRRVEPSSSNAKGIWTLNEVADYISESKWPLYVSGDPLFDKVSLLLHMDGSGSTFVDSSAYGQTVTANGDVTQSTTQSKFGGKAAYFDGSGDYLSTAAISANTLGSGDFAIEFWCYANAIGGNTCLIDQQSGLLIRQSSGNQLALYDRVTETHFYSGNNALASGQWQHIAIVRTGTTLNAYVDGVRVITGTLVTNLTGNAFRIGSFIDNSNSGYVLNGYIDELRITKGSNRGYTGSTITVPTAAFPEAIPGTDPLFSKVSLLLHADGTNGSTSFTDSGPNTRTITANGNAQISTTQSKFGGASAYFDGNGDYLSIPGSSDLDFGTGDFTIECWINRSGGKSLVSGDLYGDLMFATDVFNSGDMGFGRNGVAWDLTATAPNFQSGWNHVAVCRQGTTLRIFCNGVIVATDTSNTQSYDISNYLWIGARTSSSQGSGTGTPTATFNGYIDELRITKGIARYKSNFTPPVSAFPEPEKISVDYLVIAGGGGGGSNGGGGGGAGGYRSSVAGESSGGGTAAESSFSATPGQQYIVTVGGGGAGSTSLSSGSSGSLSLFGAISAVGGGGGLTHPNTASSGASGGSGGGGSYGLPGGAGTSGQGFSGGGSTDPAVGGGGGGAGVAGIAGTSNSAGSGGTGIASSISGTSVYRGGGGGGGNHVGGSVGGGGQGGGGAAGPYGSAQAGSPGSNSTGGGGGAGSGQSAVYGSNGGAGGSGVVIIRAPVAAASTTGSPTVTTVDSDTVYVFTSTGSITF